MKRVGVLQFLASSSCHCQQQRLDEDALTLDTSQLQHLIKNTFREWILKINNGKLVQIDTKITV